MKCYISVVKPWYSNTLLQSNKKKKKYFNSMSKTTKSIGKNTIVIPYTFGVRNKSRDLLFLCSTKALCIILLSDVAWSHSLCATKQNQNRKLMNIRVISSCVALLRVLKTEKQYSNISHFPIQRQLCVYEINGKSGVSTISN